MHRCIDTPTVLYQCCHNRKAILPFNNVHSILNIFEWTAHMTKVVLYVSFLKQKGVNLRRERLSRGTQTYFCHVTMSSALKWWLEGFAAALSLWLNTEHSSSITNMTVGQIQPCLLSSPSFAVEKEAATRIVKRLMHSSISNWSDYPEYHHTAYSKPGGIHKHLYTA